MAEPKWLLRFHTTPYYPAGQHHTSAVQKSNGRLLVFKKFKQIVAIGTGSRKTTVMYKAMFVFLYFDIVVAYRYAYLEETLFIGFHRAVVFVEHYLPVNIHIGARYIYFGYFKQGIIAVQIFSLTEQLLGAIDNGRILVVACIAHTAGRHPAYRGYGCENTVNGIIGYPQEVERGNILEIDLIEHLRALADITELLGRLELVHAKHRGDGIGFARTRVRYGRNNIITLGIGNAQNAQLRSRRLVAAPGGIKQAGVVFIKRKTDLGNIICILSGILIATQIGRQFRLSPTQVAFEVGANGLCIQRLVPHAYFVQITQHGITGSDQGGWEAGKGIAAAGGDSGYGGYPARQAVEVSLAQQTAVEVKQRRGCRIKHHRDMSEVVSKIGIRIARVAKWEEQVIAPAIQVTGRVIATQRYRLRPSG